MVLEYESFGENMDCIKSMKISQKTVVETSIAGTMSLGSRKAIYEVNTVQYEKREMYSQTWGKSPFEDNQWEMPRLEDYTGKLSVIKR
jgi:hypothetical protein